MIIGIDARMVSNVIDGAGRVMLSLLSKLHEYPQHKFIIFYRCDSAKVICSSNVEFVELNTAVSTVENLILAHRCINKYEMDVFYYSFVDIPFFLRAPVVAEVYDLFYMTDPTYFSAKKRLIYQMIRVVTWLSLHRSKILIAISGVTANQIRKLPLLSKKKIMVVPLAMNENLLTYNGEPLPDCLQPNKYILYVGNNRRHKNLPNLIEAFSRIDLGVKLLLVGKIDHRYDDPRTIVKRLHLEDKILHLGPVDDRLLATIYRNSLFVIVPSVYEGFGLPAIEAAKFSKAVLCSDIAALREVMDDSTIYFDPHDINSIEALLRVMILDSDIRQDIEKKCQNRSNIYNETKFARDTIRVLETLHN